MGSKVAKYGVHVLLFTSFLLLPYLFSPSGKLVAWPNLYTIHDRINLLTYILLAIFFYCNYYILVPKLVFAKKYIAYILVVAGFILFVTMLAKFLDTGRLGISGFNELTTTTTGLRHPGDLPPNEGPPNIDLPPISSGNRPPVRGPHGKGGGPSQANNTLLLYCIGMLASGFLRVNRRLLQTEKDKATAELSFLKVQINPHFLFNTLNSIYSLAIKKDDKTAESIVRLSELMRYVIRDANDNLLGLEKELNYIDNYIELQKSRLAETVKIDYHVEGSNFGKKIAPLILITFIENAFKHGVNPDEESEIVISIVIKDYMLDLQVSNKKVYMQQTLADSNQIGLANVIERLRLLYPKKHTLHIQNDIDNYKVLLTINLA